MEKADNRAMEDEVAKAKELINFVALCLRTVPRQKIDWEKASAESDLTKLQGKCRFAEAIAFGGQYTYDTKQSRVRVVVKAGDNSSKPAQSPRKGLAQLKEQPSGRSIVSKRRRQSQEQHFLTDLASDTSPPIQNSSRKRRKSMQQSSRLTPPNVDERVRTRTKTSATSPRQTHRRRTWKRRDVSIAADVTAESKPPCTAISASPSLRLDKPKALLTSKASSSGSSTKQPPGRRTTKSRFMTTLMKVDSEDEDLGNFMIDEGSDTDVEIVDLTQVSDKE